MKQFFGALFVLAAIIFLYKAGVLLPDLASAFGDIRGSYNPTYVPANSLNQDYNTATYEAAMRGGAYPAYPPVYGQQNIYTRDMVPFICYTSHMPIIDGVNYNYPMLCDRSFGSNISYDYPRLPNYQSYVYYPPQNPQYYPAPQPSGICQ